MEYGYNMLMSETIIVVYKVNYCKITKCKQLDTSVKEHSINEVIAQF